MSWLRGLQSTRSGNPNFTSEAREQRRKDLEKERLEKAKKREERKAFFKAGVSVPPSPSSSRSSSPQRELIHLNLPTVQLDPFIEEDRRSLPDIFHISDDVFEEIARMVNFDMKDEENGNDAMKSLGQIKLKWLPSDPEFFFTQFETELQIFEIKKQFTKIGLS